MTDGTQAQPTNGEPTPRETAILADNINEFVERQQWKQMLEAKENASEALQNVEEKRIECRRQLPPEEAEQAVRASTRAAVKSYILDCEVLFQRTELGQQLWTDTPLGSASATELFTPDPPGKGEQVQSITDIQFAGTPPAAVDTSGYGPPTITLRGVRDFLNLADTRVRYQYLVSLPGRNPDAAEPRQATSTVSVPVTLSEAAFRTTYALHTQLGPGIEIGDDQNTVNGDYSDILDNLQEAQE